MTTQELVERLRDWIEDNAAIEWPYPTLPHERIGALIVAAHRLSEMDAENKRLRELLAEALEALTPFASDADLWSGSDSLSLVEAAPGYSDALNVGDLRRARAAADKIRAGVKEGEA